LTLDTLSSSASLDELLSLTYYSYLRTKSKSVRCTRNTIIEDMTLWDWRYVWFGISYVKCVKKRLELLAMYRMIVTSQLVGMC